MNIKKLNICTLGVFEFAVYYQRQIFRTLCLVDSRETQKQTKQTKQKKRIKNSQITKYEFF